MLLENQVRKYIRRIINGELVNEAVKTADPYEYNEMLTDLSQYTAVFIGVKISAFDEDVKQLKRLGFEDNPQQIARISAMATIPGQGPRRMEEYVALAPAAAKLYAANIAQLRSDIQSGELGKDARRAWVNLYKRTRSYSEPSTTPEIDDEVEKSGVVTGPSGQTYRKTPAAIELQKAKYPFKRYELSKTPELSQLLAYKDVNPLYLGEVGALLRLRIFLNSLPKPFVFVMNNATFHMKHIMSRAKKFNINIPKPIRVIDTQTMVRYFSTPLLRQRADAGDPVATSLVKRLGNSAGIRNVINAFQISQNKAGSEDRMDNEDIEMLVRVFNTLRGEISKSLPKLPYEKTKGGYLDPETGEVVKSLDPEASYSSGEQFMMSRAAVRAAENEEEKQRMKAAEEAGVKYVPQKTRVRGRFNPSEKAKKLGNAYITQLMKAREFGSPETRREMEKSTKASDAERLGLNKDIFAKELEKVKAHSEETAEDKKAKREKAAAEKKEQRKKEREEKKGTKKKKVPQSVEEFDDPDELIKFLRSQK